MLILDEPTTGLDPHSRNELWQVIRDLIAQGTTLLLTTQYMEEADKLADDIVVIDRGQQFAHGTADELKTQIGGERMEVCIDSHASMLDARRVLAGFAIGEIHVEERRVTVPIVGGARTLTDALRSLDTDGVEIQDVGVRKPTLDDVFLALTGHAAEREASHPTLIGRDQRVL